TPWHDYCNGYKKQGRRFYDKAPPKTNRKKHLIKTMVKRFLLVDDDTDDRELFSEALVSVDPVIICDLAADAEEALKKLDKKEGPPDLIFLDINLPVMTGWQFLSNLKSTEAYKDIPVIMYSTSNNQRDKDIAKDLGALC